MRCFVHQFADENAALDYAIRNQRARRNLTDAEILACVALLDERKQEGRPTKETTPDGAVCGRSSAATAETLGVSSRTVERARTVLDHAPEEVREAVTRGETTINAAYNQTQQARRDTEDKARDHGIVEDLVLTPPPGSAPKLILPTLTDRYDPDTRHGTRKRECGQPGKPAPG